MPLKKFFVLLLTLAFAVVVVPITQGAVSLIVTNCTEAGFDNALQQASNAGGGTITFNCGGNVTIPITSEKILSKENAVFVIDGNNQVTLDGQNNFRILYTKQGRRINLTVRNITLANGHAKTNVDNSNVEYQGGAIWSGFYNRLVVENATFLNNTASGQLLLLHGGGAIFADAASITIVRNSTFIGNRAPSGGAINTLRARLTVKNSVFRDNESWGSDSGGGGIFNDGGALKIVKSLFVGNHAARFGGAFYSFSYTYDDTAEFGGTTVIKKSVFMENSAYMGGGLWKSGTDLVIVRNSTVANNQATFLGGGVVGVGSGKNYEIVNTTITGNRVVGPGPTGGGGVYNSGNISTIINSTIAFNSVTNDPASVGAAFHGDAEIKNTIIAFNTGGNSGIRACEGVITDLGNNIQYPGNTCGAGVPVIDPLIDAALSPSLASYTPGAITPTHALTENSPAINKALGCPPTDQRGVARPQGSACDIGAYEREGTRPVAFALNSPSADATISNFMFSWQLAQGASQYRLQIMTRSGKILLTQKVPASSCSTECVVTVTSSKLRSGRRLVWRVIAVNSFGKTKSEKRNFTVQ